MVLINMKKQNIWLFSEIILIFISIILILLNISNTPSIDEHKGARILPFSPEEKISYTYEECKNINRSRYIKRLFKKDYQLPMCPKSYLVLFDEFQDIMFIFNEENDENPTILTIDTFCDNSTGKC